MANKERGEETPCMLESKALEDCLFELWEGSECLPVGGPTRKREVKGGRGCQTQDAQTEGSLARGRRDECVGEWWPEFWLRSKEGERDGGGAAAEVWERLGN